MAELTTAQEQELAAYISGMYAVWLPAVENAVLGGYTRFGIAPDPAAINTTTALWRQQITQLEAQQLQPIAAQAYAEEDPEGTFSLTDAFIAAVVVATAAFLLAQLPDLQGLLATIVATAATVTAAVASVRELLNPLNPRWTAKANQVAQTEGDRWVQAATLSAAFRATARDGIQRTKEWISRDDDKVRAAHSFADGQVRPIEVPFIVGGFPMMYPKDPSAPPELVVNCRCGMRIKRTEVRRGR